MKKPLGETAPMKEFAETMKKAIDEMTKKGEVMFL